MAAASWFKYTYLAHLSKPRTQRQLYRLTKFHKFTRIIEVGIFSLERTTSLISVAQRFSDGTPISYTGLDWFDTRSEDLPPLTLKQVHRELQATGATVRLVPGDPARSISSIANTHQHTGLMMLSSAVTESQLAAAWFFFPRMIDSKTIVLRERIDSSDRPTFELLNHSLLNKQAASLGERKAA